MSRRPSMRLASSADPQDSSCGPREVSRHPSERLGDLPRARHAPRVGMRPGARPLATRPAGVSRLPIALDASPTQGGGGLGLSRSPSLAPSRPDPTPRPPRPRCVWPKGTKGARGRPSAAEGESQLRRTYASPFTPSAAQERTDGDGERELERTKEAERDRGARERTEAARDCGCEHCRDHGGRRTQTRERERERRHLDWRWS